MSTERQLLVDPLEVQREKDFVAELSELSRKHGIGIAGEPHLFVMEREDYAHSYASNADSRLVIV